MCGYVSVSNYIQHAQLQLNMDSSIQEAIDLHFSWTDVEEDLNCDSCSNKSHHFRRIILDENPEGVMVHLVRTARHSSMKISNNIQIKNCMYELQAVILLQRYENVDGGHYTALIKKSSVWLHCNDSSVRNEMQNASEE